MKNIFGIEVCPFQSLPLVILIGSDQYVQQVTEDGAPAGRKDFLVWNPPLKDAMDPSLGRVNSMTEATRLMRFLMANGVRVILFCKVRDLVASPGGC